MAKILEQRVPGLKKCTIKLDKGDEGTDSAKLFIGVEKKPIYQSMKIFGYAYHKNTFDYNMKICKYNEILPKNVKALQKLNIYNTMNKIHESEMLENTKIGTKL